MLCIYKALFIFLACVHTPQFASLHISPVNGKWSNWIESGVCSAECDYGVQLLVRECDSPRPEHGGLECRGEKKDTKDCYRQDCPGVQVCSINILACI